MRVRYALFALVLVALLGFVVYRGAIDAPHQSEQTVPSESDRQIAQDVPAHRTQVRPAEGNRNESPPAGAGVIRGQVFLPGGYPAPAATLEIYTPATRGKADTLTMEVDADGCFVFRNLEIGWYRIYASQENRAATASCRLTPPELAAELALYLEAGAPISGHILGEGGAGVASAVVVPVMHDDDPIQPCGWGFASSADGSFLSPILPERAWRFEVRANGYATTLTPPIVVGTRDARLYLNRGGYLSGIVVDIDSGAPVQNMALRAKRIDAPVESREVRTGMGGEFYFTELLTGTTRVTSSDPDRVLVPAIGTFDVGTENENDDIVLQAGGAATIAGTILDVAGNPVAGITVGADTTSPATSMPGRSAPSDERGSYRVGGLAAGTYNLSLAQMGPIQTPVQSVILEAGESKSGVDFILPFGISVSGHVYDGNERTAAGAAVEGKYFSGPFEEGWIRATANGDGAFQVFGPKPESELFIRATTIGASSPWYGPIIVSPEGVHDVELILANLRDGVIAGTVVSDTGQPIRCVVGVDDLSEDDFQAPMEFVVSGRDGSFVVPVRTPGEYEIYLGPYDTDGYRNPTDSSVRLSLANGQSQRGLRLTYSDEQPFAVAGRVVDVDGKPIAGAMINPAIPAGSTDKPMPTGRTDEAGNFTLSMMPVDGPYRLVVMAPGYVVQQVPDVAAGTADLTVTLDKNP